MVGSALDADFTESKWADTARANNKTGITDFILEERVFLVKEEEVLKSTIDRK